MRTSHHHHDGTLLYDLDYLTAGRYWAFCCRCRHYVWIGEPERFGSALALLHRRVLHGSLLATSARLR